MDPEDEKELTEVEELEGETPEEEATEDEEQTEDADETEDEGETLEAEEETGEIDIVLGEANEDDTEAEEFKGPAPQWVKDLRKTARQLERENKELKRKQEEAAKATGQEEIGAKPTLEDFDYDADKFEKAYDEWTERKQRVEAREAEMAERSRKAAEAWQQRQAGYESRKSELRVKDYGDAEADVQAALGEQRFKAIIDVADNPEHLVYVLGKNPERLSKLAQYSMETAAAKFIYELGVLSKETRVMPRKPSTAPERKVAGATGSGSGGSSKLERARKKAEETGDYTEVRAIRRQLRKAERESA